MPILKKTKPVITAKRLRELLVYDPESGEMRWAVNRRGPTRAGDVAGSPRPDGYFSIKVEGQHYLAHRLVWLYVHGKFPEGDIDHIDGCRANNRIANLRDISRSQNLQNVRRARANSSSGVLGAIQQSRRAWLAQICVNGVYRKVGPFPTAEEAGKAYLALKAELHPAYVPPAACEPS